MPAAWGLVGATSISCVWEHSQSDTIKMPPGRSASTSRANTASRVGRCINNSRVWMRSKLPAGNGVVRMSSSTMVMHGPWRTCRASVSIAVTCPSGAMRSDSQVVMVPPPAPASRHRQPGWTSRSRTLMVCGSRISASRRTCRAASSVALSKAYGVLVTAI
jgi:hypothetical protein